MANLYRKGVTEALAALSDLIGSDSVMALSFGESNGRWYLDWELRVKRRPGFLGVDAERSYYESLFEAISIEDPVDRETAERFRERLCLTAKWIDCDEFAWRKSYRRMRKSDVNLVRETQVPVVGFGGPADRFGRPLPHTGTDESVAIGEDMP